MKHFADQQYSNIREYSILCARPLEQNILPLGRMNDAYGTDEFGCGRNPQAAAGFLCGWRLIAVHINAIVDYFCFTAERGIDCQDSLGRGLRDGYYFVG